MFQYPNSIVMEIFSVGRTQPVCSSVSITMSHYHFSVTTSPLSYHITIPQSPCHISISPLPYHITIPQSPCQTTISYYHISITVSYYHISITISYYHISITTSHYHVSTHIEIKSRKSHHSLAALRVSGTWKIVLKKKHNIYMYI